MPTLKMQDHSDYEHQTTVNIALIAGMAPGDRVYDTTLDRPMYYNNVSSAWERYIIVLNNQAAFPAGALATPSIYFDGDPDTGWWRSAADQWSWAGAGVERLQMTSAGQLRGGDGSTGSPTWTFINDFNTGIYRHDTDALAISAGAAPIVFADAAITGLTPGNDNFGRDVFVEIQSGGADTDSSGGEDGGSLTITIGDGSDAGGGVTAGGDGGDYHIQSGVGGAGAGGGAAGADGLVYLEKSDASGFWEDVRIVPTLKLAGVNNPNLSAWQPTAAGATFYLYEFDNGDEAFFTCEIPHSYLEGTTLKPHVHWTPRARGVAENGNTVFWEIDYTIANPGANFPVSANVQLHDTCSGANERHEQTDSGNIAGAQISAALVIRLFRAAGDTWAGVGNNNQPALIEFDIHFQTNSNGSRTELTK